MPKANGDKSGAWLWPGQPISRQSVRRIPQLHASAPQQRKRNMLINAPQRGNVSKACKIVCQEMIPACSDDTVHKLRDLHPERSLNLNLENLPTPESLNAFWDGEEGTALRNKFFNITKVRKYFRNCQAPSRCWLRCANGLERTRN